MTTPLKAALSILVAAGLMVGGIIALCDATIGRHIDAGPQLVADTPEGVKVYRVFDPYKGWVYFGVGKDGSVTPMPVTR